MDFMRFLRLFKVIKAFSLQVLRKWPEIVP